MGRAFDHYMLHVEAGNNAKTCRLSDAERCAWFLGVLPIAAKSPVRGALLIGRLRADAGDVARQAAVSVRTAKSALRRAEEIGLLDVDSDGFAFVHDFDIHNPEPKKDATAAERQARRRARLKERAAEVTGASRRDARDKVTRVTPPEVEVEVEEPLPPSPPAGGTVTDDLVGAEYPASTSSKRQRDRQDVADLRAAWAAANRDVLTDPATGQVVDSTLILHGASLLRNGQPRTPEAIVAVLRRAGFFDAASEAAA